MNVVSARIGTIEQVEAEGMLLDALLSYAHFVGVFLVFGALCAEAFVIRLPQTGASMRLLARIDLFFGLSAAFVLAAGFSRVYFGAKGPDYYWHQPFFWAKLGVFAFVGLISVAPTLKFLSWRRALNADAAFAPGEGEVKTLRRLIMAELHLFALIPLFAALMARGIGA